MDLAKAVSLMMNNPGSSADYQGWCAPAIDIEELMGRRLKVIESIRNKVLNCKGLFHL